MGNSPLPGNLTHYLNHLAGNTSLTNYELPIPTGVSECEFDEKFKRAFSSLLPYAEQSYPPLPQNYLGIQGLVNSNSIIDMAAELSGSPLPIFPNAPLQKSRPPKLNGRMDYREKFFWDEFGYNLLQKFQTP